MSPEQEQLALAAMLVIIFIVVRLTLIVIDYLKEDAEFAKILAEFEQRRKDSK